MLRALVLARHHQTCGQVGDSNGGIGHVDVLAAGAGAAVGVDTQVFLVDFYFAAGVLEERHHGYGGEARVPPVLGVEGRHAHQSVDASLRGHEAGGVAALDDEGGGQDAGFLALADLGYLQGKAPALDPALVHPQQHLGPVLGVGAAVLGVHLAHGVEFVVLAREQRPQLQLVELGGQLSGHGLQVAGYRTVIFLAGQFEQRFGVGQAALERAEQVDVVLQGGVLAPDGLGGVGVVPQVGARKSGSSSASRLRLARCQGRHLPRQAGAVGRADPR